MTDGKSKQILEVALIGLVFVASGYISWKMANTLGKKIDGLLQA